MNPFYIVWNPASPHPPTFRHATQSLAVQEAERLAQLHPGAHFHVMRFVSISHVPKPSITFYADGVSASDL